MNNWMGKSVLDRNVDARDEADLDLMWRDAFVLTVDVDGGFAADNGRPRELEPSGQRHPDDILLGSFDGRPWFARPVPTISDDASATWREVDTQWQAPVAAAVALVRWHAMASHCEHCGAATTPDGAGTRRKCPACGLLAFPRQDPAVIVAVLDPSSHQRIDLKPSILPTGTHPRVPQQSSHAPIVSPIILVGTYETKLRETI